MKKWSRWVVYPFVGLIVGIVLLDGIVALISRSAWFNKQVDRAMENTLTREFALSRMGANLSGIFIEDLQIAEKEGFERGKFAQIKRAQLRISLLHLLHGHVKIKGLVMSGVQVNLLKRADGTTNWDDWLSAPASEETQPKSAASPLNLTAGWVRLEDLSVSFVDQQAPRTLEISEVNLELSKFSFREEFSISLWANFLHQENHMVRKIPILLHAKVHLNQFDWAGAYATVQMLKARYEKSSLVLEGTVHNFTSPQADLKLTAHNLSADLWKDITSLPAFNLEKATGIFKFAVDTPKQTLVVKKATVQAPGLEIDAHGNMSYAKSLKYTFDTTGHVVLGEAGRWFTALADMYRLVGTVKTQATLTQDKISGKIALEDVGGYVAQVGQVSNITGEVSGWEAMDFKTGQARAELTGKFEASPFDISAQAHQTPQKIKAQLKASAKEILWNMPENTTQKTDDAPAQSGKTAWPLPPMDLKMDIAVDKLDVPYFYGTHMALNTDLQGFSPDLKQTQGQIHLRTEAGKIQDIYKLTNANPLTKVLFMSLNVTGKVFNSLNVFGVLKSLGGGITSMVSGDNSAAPAEVKTQTILGPDGEPLEVPVVQTAQQISGEMDYDKFDTLVNFKDGTATVKEGTFVSTMMSMRLDGTTDFNTGIVDLTVHAAPGRHEVDGMMPLTLKIGGTIEEPKGNMQLIGSVASLVTQSVTNNVVSRQVTKGLKGLFGLFKKDKQPAPAEEPATTAESAQAQP